MKAIVIFFTILSCHAAKAEVYDYIVDLNGEGISQCRKSDSKTITDWAKKSIAEAKKDGANCEKLKDHDLIECDYKSRAVKIVGFNSKSECEDMRGLLFAKLHLEKKGKAKSPQKTIKPVYVWKKSSFGDGCAEISEVDSKVFQNLCSPKSTSIKLISLDCSKVKEMTMEGIDLFSTENYCLEVNK